MRLFIRARRAIYDLARPLCNANDSRLAFIRWTPRLEVRQDNRVSPNARAIGCTPIRQYPSAYNSRYSIPGHPRARTCPHALTPPLNPAYVSDLVGCDATHSKAALIV